MMTFKNSEEDLIGNTISEVIYTVHNAEDIDAVIEHFRFFLLAVSFHPETVNRHLKVKE